ncbi:spectinomycin phosphotransferase [Kribbella voronezhensis]|uniref:Spectinomycin phosphotransferase n=1 Tax=Kribbella voronezhensis TaxID=2512212 RepID=A0A4R7TF23_9ACTN|nr:phosphotransferase [Kribbella voronezhensis]TDU90784.1 spectinomycin phosphotransferase [Kribbella voronezhensis]
MTDKLRRWLAEDFGLDVLDLVQVHEGADVAAEVWRAVGDASYAVKWSGGGTDAGPRATAYLASRGVQEVPGPVRTLTGGLWSEREGRRLSVMPWIAGERASETGLTLEQWTSYGGLLADVHRAEPPAELRAVLPRINPINARMPALARSVRARLATPADTVEEELAAVWEAHDDLITAVFDQCADLAARDLGGTAVLCHADPHLANVLVTAEQLYLIDWDDVVLAPPEQDLLFFLGGMGSIGPTSPAEQDAFFTGYGSVELDPTRLAYYRSARAIEDFTGWSDYVLSGALDRTQRLEVVRFILSPEGLAVRALA